MFGPTFVRESEHRRYLAKDMRRRKD